jgi:hypothetical protein
MGTNYYLREDICDTCNRYREVHIGKSSVGWKFTFNVINDVKSYQDIKILLKELTDGKSKIFDEYNEEIKYEDFINIVENSKDGKSSYHEISNPDIHLMTLDSDGWTFSDSEFN